MNKNYKINYNQYKHLIDVYQSGDFLIDSLDKPVDLITYRRLLTEDNIMYFTQNTRRTCKIPLGIKKVDSSLKTIDLMVRDFTYRHSNVDVLNGFVKLTMCYLMQNYKPDEYEVYYDLGIKELEGLESFHFISSTKDLDDIFTTISNERHRKYFDYGVYTYKEFRKSNSEKLIVIISINPSNINLLNKIGSNSLRDGIAIIKLEQSDISNSSTISLDNTIRPNISDEDLKTEVKIYNRMLKEYNIMLKGCNSMLDNGNSLERNLENIKSKETKFIVGNFEISSSKMNDEKVLFIKAPSNNWVYSSFDEFQLDEVSSSLSAKLLKTVKVGIFKEIKCEHDKLVVTLDKEHVQPRGIAFFLTFLFNILESSEETFKVFSMIPNKLISTCEVLLDE